MDINVVDVIFYDNTYLKNKANFDNITLRIVGGTVYRNQHRQSPSTVNIHNLSIQTTHLDIGQGNGLFNFKSTDIVTISYITVLYIYDASLYCTHAGAILSSITNSKFDSYLCPNPMMFVRNEGILKIDNIQINTDIFYGNIQPTHNNTRFAYEGLSSSVAFGDPFILNEGAGTINISNAKIINTVCYNLIRNHLELSISNMQVIQSLNGEDYNPNSLHSETIIYQSS